MLHVKAREDEESPLRDKKRFWSLGSTSTIEVELLLSPLYAASLQRMIRKKKAQIRMNMVPSTHGASGPRPPTLLSTVERRSRPAPLIIRARNLFTGRHATTGTTRFALPCCVWRYAASRSHKQWPPVPLAASYTQSHRALSSSCRPAW